MRFILAALLLLAACATTPTGLPRLYYADAASRGSVASFFAGRPSTEQVDEATENWSRALGDAFACDVPMRQILDAGLVGALEIGAMNAPAAAASVKSATESPAISVRLSAWLWMTARARRRGAAAISRPGRRPPPMPGAKLSSAPAPTASWARITACCCNFSRAEATNPAQSARR